MSFGGGASLLLIMATLLLVIAFQDVEVLVRKCLEQGSSIARSILEVEQLLILLHPFLELVLIQQLRALLLVLCLRLVDKVQGVLFLLLQACLDFLIVLDLLPGLISFEH